MQDPASDLISFLTKGENLPAIGAALVLIVGFVRNVLLAKWPWAQTKLGGYALAWGITSITFIGTSLEQNVAISLRLVEIAFATGLLASGLLDHFRDLLTALAPPPKVGAFDPKTGQTDMAKAAGIQRSRIRIGFPQPNYFRLAATASLFGLVALIAVSLPACPNPPKPVQIVIDCTKQSHESIEALVAQFAPLLIGNSPDWGTVESKALDAGETIGGCALAEFVNTYLTRRGATVTAEATWQAHDTLEHFRTAHANGATFHTAAGDL